MFLMSMVQKRKFIREQNTFEIEIFERLRRLNLSVHRIFTTPLHEQRNSVNPEVQFTHNYLIFIILPEYTESVV